MASNLLSDDRVVILRRLSCDSNLHGDCLCYFMPLRRFRGHTLQKNRAIPTAIRIKGASGIDTSIQCHRPANANPMPTRIQNPSTRTPPSFRIACMPNVRTPVAPLMNAPWLRCICRAFMAIQCLFNDQSAESASRFRNRFGEQRRIARPERFELPTYSIVGSYHQIYWRGRILGS